MHSRGSSENYQAYCEIAHYLVRIEEYGPCKSAMPDQMKYTLEELQEAVAASKSWNQLTKLLKVQPPWSNRLQLRNLVRELSIDTSHFWKKASIEDILKKNGRRGIGIVKALLKIGRKYECVECGLGPEWQGKPLTLQVDHINGDNKDHRQENLRFLCPNCHTQTPTYGNKRR